MTIQLEWYIFIIWLWKIHLNIFGTCLFCAASSLGILFRFFFSVASGNRTTFLQLISSQHATSWIILERWILVVQVLARFLSTLYLWGRLVRRICSLDTCLAPPWFLGLTFNQINIQGSTTVALYGLGNIRDERLNRMFQVIQRIPHLLLYNCLLC